MSDEQASRRRREQLIWAGKIAVGAVVGVVMMGVVAPIALAIIIGLAAGH